MAEGGSSASSKYMTAEFKCSEASCKNGWNSVRSLNLPEKCSECKTECSPIKYRPATRPEQILGSKMKMVAKYKCSQCTKKWKAYNSSGGPKSCPKCLTLAIRPYRYLSSTKVKPQVPRRQFGHFSCSCGNKWKSGNAWDGKYQECLLCFSKILPYQLDPLQHRGPGFSQTPHVESLCEMCKTLGHSCKGYTALPGSSVVFGDGESIISLTSTDSGGTRRGNEDDRYRTPVASDDEDFLTEGVKNLRF